MFFSMPVEMPRATHYGNNYFAVYSNKIHRVCHFYSNLEYYNFLSLEINPEVKKFCEQPLKIEIIQENKLQYAIYDMWVLYQDGREEMQEVKYTSMLTGNEGEALRAQEQIRREQLWCKENNIDFVIRTEKNISQGRYFLNNAHTMAARLRRYIPKEDKFYNHKVIELLYLYTFLTVDELKSSNLLPINAEIEHLCYMYEKGLIKMNIAHQPLGNKTEVSLWQNSI